MVQNQNLMSKTQMGRWSEEEYLFGYDKYNSNMYSNNWGDLLGSSNDKDVHHKRIRVIGTQKYQRESCYHRIECITATFLAAFMLRRPLNSDALAITTQRKPERVFNGTDTQVRAQMINKCRIKMVQRELYNVRDLPRGRDRKEREIILYQSKLYLCFVFIDL